jgi:hypothetical protein
MVSLTEAVMMRCSCCEAVSDNASLCCEAVVQNSSDNALLCCAAAGPLSQVPAASLGTGRVTMQATGRICGSALQVSAE